MQRARISWMHPLLLLRCKLCIMTVLFWKLFMFQSITKCVFEDLDRHSLSPLWAPWDRIERIFVLWKMIFFFYLKPSISVQSFVMNILNMHFISEGESFFKRCLRFISPLHVSVLCNIYNFLHTGPGMLRLISCWSRSVGTQWLVISWWSQTRPMRRANQKTQSSAFLCLLVFLLKATGLGGLGPFLTPSKSVFTPNTACGCDETPACCGQLKSCRKQSTDLYS